MLFRSRDEKQVKDIRAARAKAQAEDRQLAQSQIGSEAMKNAADAHKANKQAGAVK